MNVIWNGCTKTRALIALDTLLLGAYSPFAYPKSLAAHVRRRIFPKIFFRSASQLWRLLFKSGVSGSADSLRISSSDVNNTIMSLPRF